MADQHRRSRTPGLLLCAGLLAACASAPSGELEELPALPAEPPAAAAQVVAAEPEPDPEPEPEPEPAPEPAPELRAALEATGEHSELLAALERAELAGLLDLDDDRPLTLLAPTDDAFAALSKRDQRQLARPEALRARLRRHLLIGAYDRAAIASTAEVESVDGEALTIGVDGDVDGGGVAPTIDRIRLGNDAIEVRGGSLIPIDALLPASPKGFKPKPKPKPEQAGAATSEPPAKPATPTKPASTKPSAPDKPASTKPSAADKPPSTKPSAPDKPASTKPSAADRPPSTKPSAADKPAKSRPPAP